MNKCELFEFISEQVWDFICRNHVRNNRLNEEGISRQTILDQIQNYVENQHTFNVFAQKARNEVNTGGDLEIFLDNGQRRFYRILLQAKLMNVDCCFEHLNRNSGSTGRKQYDTLKSFATQSGSDAYYLMYNGCPDYRGADYDCAGYYSEKQFGCAILEIDEVKKHCEDNSTGTLGSSRDKKPFGKPWRFLTCCDYQYLSGNKLYDLSEIDMDPYFQNLFTPPNLISFITPEQIRRTQLNENNNDIIHKDGWNPSGRIIISKYPMRKSNDGIIEI
ncbi:DUF6615 family protein [Flavobacterium sp.]|uniref:DUF6615 family protein n=1 Tax=Flavobacterium sp. TaxID=239 RepID=UPI00261C027F|nr:DUF6615 family protein [Flavobacterium sp.]